MRDELHLVSSTTNGFVFCFCLFGSKYLDFFLIQTLEKQTKWCVLSAAYKDRRVWWFCFIIVLILLVACSIFSWEPWFFWTVLHEMCMWNRHSSRSSTAYKRNDLMVFLQLCASVIVLVKHLFPFILPGHSWLMQPSTTAGFPAENSFTCCIEF